MTDKVHPDIDKPTSVTHFICPKSSTRDGEPFQTRHLIYPYAGASRPKCQYCGIARGELAERNGVVA